MRLYQQALEVLEWDLIRNYCVMEMLKTASDYDIDILNESVFIRLKGNGNFVMVSAPHKQDGEKLIKKNLTHEDKAFYTVDDWSMIYEGRTLDYHMVCDQLYVPETVNYDDDEEGIVELTCDQAGYIYENYDHKHIITEQYIIDRISLGPAVGIMDNGVLAGWVMTHEEGTMGVLTVLPQYRRKGYAQKLNAALVRRLRALGKPCIVHILKGNTASRSLAEKSGMRYSCDVHWFAIK